MVPLRVARVLMPANRGPGRRPSAPSAWSDRAAAYATNQPPDLERARTWYRRAALKGDERGLFEYGLMLILGEGGPKRPARGRRYLERAAALGHVDALKVLAYGLSRGAYSYRRSTRRAKGDKRLLRLAQARLRRAVGGGRVT